jgi:2-keto-4-pentenoate hydratase
VTLDSVITTAADRLEAAQASKVPCAPVRTILPADRPDAGYHVQTLITARALAAGRRIVGHKIGLTAPSVQQQLGVDQPDFGTLFADMVHPDGATIPITAVMQPRIEAEVALVLGADLDAPDLAPHELIAAINYVLPAIEIVGSRIAGWDITFVDTVADNASSGAVVLGNRPVQLRDVDLRTCGMALFNRGEPVSVGAGAACLGHPLNAALWLARTLATRGQPLRRGAVVLTGALGPMVTPIAGQRYEARIDGLGTVSVHFSAGDQP